MRQPSRASITETTCRYQAKASTRARLTSPSWERGRILITDAMDAWNSSASATVLRNVIARLRGIDNTCASSMARNSTSSAEGSGSWSASVSEDRGFCSMRDIAASEHDPQMNTFSEAAANHHNSKQRDFTPSRAPAQDGFDHSERGHGWNRDSTAAVIVVSLYGWSFLVAIALALTRLAGG